MCGGTEQTVSSLSSSGSMIVSVGLSLVAGTYVYYSALLYTALAIAYFMVTHSNSSHSNLYP